MTTKRKRPSKAGAVELDEKDLEAISGGPSRQEQFGDPIGNYNFKVEIDGVTKKTATLKSGEK